MKQFELEPEMEMEAVDEPRVSKRKMRRRKEIQFDEEINLP